MRDATGELHHFQSAGHLAVGVRQHLAVLGGDGGGEFLAIALQQILQAEQDAGAPQWRHGGPGRPGLRRRADRQFDLGGGAERDPGGDLTGGRVEHVAGTAALTGQHPPADEMSDLVHGAVPPDLP
jgi:hypothetical protein